MLFSIGSDSLGDSNELTTPQNKNSTGFGKLTHNRYNPYTIDKAGGKENDVYQRKMMELEKDVLLGWTKRTEEKTARTCK